MSAKEEPGTAVVAPPRPTDLPPHPLCAQVPRPSAEDEMGLEKSIVEFGVREPIMVAKVGMDTAVIDGMTRQKLVLKLYDAGIYTAKNGAPIQLDYFHMPDPSTTKDILNQVMAKNTRRNLNGGQKACLAIIFHKEKVKLAKEAGTFVKIEGDIAQALADEYGVNRRYIVHANTLYAKKKTLFDAVLSGVMQIKEAHKAYQKGVHGDDGPPTGDDKDYFDARKIKVPENLKKVFADVDAYDSLSADLRKIGQRIKTLGDSASGKFLSPGPLTSALGSVASTLTRSKPYYVCSTCGGKGRSCPKCHGAGFKTKVQETAAAAHPAAKKPGKAGSGGDGSGGKEESAKGEKPVEAAAAE